MIKLLSKEETKKATLQRLYNNKLAVNIVAIGDKDTRKQLITKVKALCEAVISRNANKSQIKFYATDEEKDAVKNIVAYALQLDDNTIISNTMLAKAVISACQHKFVTESKGVKVGNWSYSVSNFLKSLNASIVGKIEKSSFAD